MITTKINKGFTLIELLVVMAIIAILASIVFFSIVDARLKGRDAGKKVQIQEVLKGLELYYSDTGYYPEDGTPGVHTTGNTLTNINAGFINASYFKRLPENPDEYQYCVSDDKKSMVLSVNTEYDAGGSNYCRVTRGPGTPTYGYGCTTWMNTNASDTCITRF